MSELLLADQFFCEGPRWHDGRLWFSDFYDHAVKAVDLDGCVETIVEVPGQPSGLGWMPDGALLVVSMTDRRLLRFDGATLVEHADLSGVAGFHCNDMVVDGAGRAYVGNFGFDLDQAFASRPARDVWKDHPTAALARVDPDGSVHVVAEALDFPNGSVITPDERTLIVAETLGSRLSAFDIGDDGSLSNRRVWAQFERRAPDGICLDADGHVWFADATNSCCVLAAEGGEVIDQVDTDQHAYACMLGGEDGRTLFILTAPSSAPQVASARRGARIVTTRVAAPHAGRP